MGFFFKPVCGNADGTVVSYSKNISASEWTLVDSGTLKLDYTNVFDLVLTANTTNKVSIVGTADNDIMTIMIRPTGNFTFGGFDTSQFRVPNDLPTSLNGNALITQWLLCDSTGKYMCVNARLSPIF